MAATKPITSLRTSSHTSVPTRGSARSPAIGSTATRSLRVQTSWPATTGPTPVKSASPARCAPSSSPGATT
ncbi:rCG28326 [Rattus norvegicus]|uniref:RCG28326 n=1 Tax=Rattus norvegicus TaxID=10116 RepID=A6IEI2_RAT|nr:rCG28326 [Rattus norvegicus]